MFQSTDLVGKYETLRMPGPYSRPDDFEKGNKGSTPLPEEIIDKAIERTPAARNLR